MTEFNDRLRLAAAALRMRQDERGFVSDDDVLNVAERFTVSDLELLEHCVDPWLVDLTDLDRLCDGLYDLLEQSEESP